MDSFVELHLTSSISFPNFPNTALNHYTTNMTWQTDAFGIET